MDDFRLRVFATVADCGSFTDAARRLGISQPAVSMNIRELEAELGSVLFERKSGKTVLSESGTLFNDYVRKILYWYDKVDAVFVKKTEKPQEGQLIELSEGKQARISVDNDEIKIKLI